MNNMKNLMSSNSIEWETPREYFDKLNEEFNFTLDPCATKENAKCKKFYTKEDNGLKKEWEGERVFCNPPYGKEIKKWVEKCFDEKNKAELIVMLIPARTDTAYFHDWIYNKAEIRFIKGRIKFLVNNKEKGSAPFPSMIVIYKSRFF